MRRNVFLAFFVTLLCCVAPVMAGANEIDDANVAAFNKVTKNVDWPTGLGREAKLVKFTADWTPPADPVKSGGEFFWVVLDKSLITRLDNGYYVIKNFISSYRKNNGKLAKSGTEKIVALVHQDVGVKNYLGWIFRPWINTPGKPSASNKSWTYSQIAGRNYVKPKWAIGTTVITAPENVRDFIGAGSKDNSSYRVKIEENTVYVPKMRSDYLCFHRDGAKGTAKELKIKRPYLSNVKVNGLFPQDADFQPESKPFTLEITPIPEHMPQGW